MIRFERAVVLLLAVACGGSTPPVPERTAPVPQAPATPSTPQPVAADEPAAVVDAVPAVDPQLDAPAVATDRRASVFFRATKRDRATVWQASAIDPDVPEQLPIVVDFDRSGALGIGTATPLLAANGTWLAYLDHGHLSLASLDGAAKERITRHGPAQVTVLIAGFAPDSSQLLYAQGEVQAEDALPLPPDVKEGFYLLDLLGRESKHLAALPACTGWSADSTRIVFERKAADGAAELAALELATGELLALQRIDAPLGHSQLAIGRDLVVYVRMNAERESQLVRTALDGSARVELSENGGFARFQQPRLSPDDARVAYRDGDALKVIASEGGTSTDIGPCSASCEHTWESPTALLVLEGGELARRELGGAKTVIATEVIGFAVAGDGA